jgi:hypothetical protein
MIDHDAIAVSDVVVRRIQKYADARNARWNIMVSECASLSTPHLTPHPFPLHTFN